MTIREAGKVLELREQIQEDIISYVDSQNGLLSYQMASDDEYKDALCQIIADNFNKFQKETE
jgi:hypothetical protein